MKRKITVSLALILSLVLGSYLAVGSSLAGGLVVEGNKGREGETVDLNAMVSQGQYTLVDFWSPYCPPCLKIAPYMEKLAEKRADLKVVKLNINRPGTQGIDWKSPLAQQYNLKSIPYLVIFDKKGKQIANGQQALDVFINWLKKANLYP